VSRNDIPNIDDVDNQYFINATPIEINSIKNKIIDLRPHTEDGKIVSKLQAIHQFKIYTGIDYE
jgi:shikimate 5-dehydrogenase